MNVLVVFGTTDGQTARVAERIAETIRLAGHSVMLSDIRSLPRELNPGAYDGIIVGGSLHAQGYQRRVSGFIRKNLAALRSHPSAFFSVCLAIASLSKAERDQAWAIPLRFVQKLGWRPDQVTPFAGALMFSRYGFLRRAIMKKIAKAEMGYVDASRDTVFTDWQQVQLFALSFVRRMEAGRQDAPVRREEAQPSA